MFGLSQDCLQKSSFTYSADLDKRDLMETFMKDTISPQTSRSSGKDLSKDQVLKAITLLNESQVKAISETKKKYPRDSDEGA